MLWWNLRQLRSKDPRTRLRAANKLGESREQRAVEPLLAALSDKEPGVRKAATHALGLIRDELAVKPLISAIKDGDRHVRQAAAQGLGIICDPREDPLAIGSQIYRPRDEGAVEPLAAALKDEDSGVRQAAAMALGKIGIVNERAVEALAEFGSPAAPALLVALEHGLNNDVKYKARRALSKIGGLKVSVLTAALKDQDRDVRVGAANALKERSDLRAVEQLVAALKDKDNGVRQAAARALGELGDPRAVDQLVATLKKDKNDFVRSAAAKALGEIRDKRAVQPLLAVLKNPCLSSHDEAVWALGEIGDPQAVESLVSALRHPYSNRRQYAAEALGKIGDPRAIGPLRGALKDENTYVREESKEALDKIGWKPASVEEKVRLALALRQLKKLVRLGAAAVPALLATLEDQASEMRGSAAQALRLLHRVPTDDKQKALYAQAFSEYLRGIDPRRPVCTCCARNLEGPETVLGTGDLALFRGSVCFACAAVLCTDCLGQKVERCPLCHGETKPAYQGYLQQLREAKVVL